MNIAQYNARLAEIRQKHAQEMVRINQHQDEHLTPEGLEKARAEMAARARASLLPHLERLQQEFKSDVGTLNGAADEAIPKSEGSTRDAWTRVETLLAAGEDLSDIIRAADAPTLHAIREWAPTWLQAREHKLPQIVRTSPDVLENNIRDRWVEILPNATYAANLKESLEAKPDIARFEETAKHFRDQLEGKRTGVSTLAAAFGAIGAAQEAGRRIPARQEAS